MVATRSPLLLYVKTSAIIATVSYLDHPPTVKARFLCFPFCCA
jgi:hypothetical protein